MQIERIAFELIESRKYLACDRVHCRPNALRLDRVELLKRSDIRMKRARPVKLCNLPDVSQIVECPFVHQLSHGDGANLCMLPFAPHDRSWHVSQKRKTAIALVAKLLQ